MMEPMRLDDAAHIGRTRQIAVADPLVDEHVVETEIDRAIGSDAAAHPCPGVAPAKPHAREEAEDRGYGEHYGEPVVFLEKAVARLVVALVKDRKCVVWGKSVSVRVDPGGRRIVNKQRQTIDTTI